MTVRHGSDRVTRGIRVQVEPTFLADESHPESGRFLFAYRVRITNEGQRPATLLSRHWIIVDSEGERQEVRGDGVVGQRPTLSPGESFEYSSYCPLEREWGTMEGAYRFLTESGEAFDVEIGRFYLVGEPYIAPVF